MINARLFWQHVRRTDFCWFWTGSTNKAGYGVHGAILAHRASWMLLRGELDSRRKLLHTCDNRRCVNPNHLYPGTQMDNVRDMLNRGRGVWRAGDKNHNAKLSEAQAKEIIALCKTGEHTKAAIGRRFGVTAVLIGHIAKGRAWAHLDRGAQQ